MLARHHPSARIIWYRCADNARWAIIKIGWPLYRGRVDGSWSRFRGEGRGGGGGIAAIWPHCRAIMKPPPPPPLIGGSGQVIRSPMKLSLFPREGRRFAAGQIPNSLRGGPPTPTHSIGVSRPRHLSRINLPCRCHTHCSAILPFLDSSRTWNVNF